MNEPLFGEDGRVAIAAFAEEKVVSHARVADREAFHQELPDEVRGGQLRECLVERDNRREIQSVIGKKLQLSVAAARAGKTAFAAGNISADRARTSWPRPARAPSAFALAASIRAMAAMQAVEGADRKRRPFQTLGDFMPATDNVHSTSLILWLARRHHEHGLAFEHRLASRPC